MSYTKPLSGFLCGIHELSFNRHDRIYKLLHINKLECATNKSYKANLLKG